MARHRRRYARIPRVLTVAALAAIAFSSSAAGAHPYGQKPVALIAQSANGVELTWVIATDDARILINHLGLGPVKASSIGGHQEFTSYFFERTRVRVGERSCAYSLAGVDEVTGGIQVRARFDCGGPVERATVHVSLLHDISADYITLYQARARSGRLRGAFAPGATDLSIDFATTATSPAPQPSSSVPPRAEGRTAKIIAMLQGRAGAVPFGGALLLAFAFGAFHAITPGHGKTLTAAYIVGAGGTTRQAFGLGGVVAATHAASVAILGGVAIALDRLVLPSETTPMLEIATGILVVGLGIQLMRARRHSHDNDAEHAHAMPARRLAAIGFVGGLVPSPEAVGIVLVAFSLHRWQAGVALLASFSVGLAVVVLGVAVAAVRGGGIIRRLGGGRIASSAPRVASAAFVAIGVLLVASGARRI